MTSGAMNSFSPSRCSRRLDDAERCETPDSRVHADEGAGIDTGQGIFHRECRSGQHPGDQPVDQTVGAQARRGAPPMFMDFSQSFQTREVPFGCPGGERQQQPCPMRHIAIQPAALKRVDVQILVGVDSLTDEAAGVGGGGFPLQQQRDQRPADPPVAVRHGVDMLEHPMRQHLPHQLRSTRFQRESLPLHQRRRCRGWTRVEEHAVGAVVIRCAVGMPLPLARRGSSMRVGYPLEQAPVNVQNGGLQVG